MRRIAAEAERYADSVVPKPASTPANAYSGAPSYEQILAERSTPQQLSALSSPEAEAERAVRRKPDNPTAAGVIGGLGEYAHGVGDTAEAVSAPLLYGGRQLGKGIVSGLGGTLPAQKQSDWEGLKSDFASPVHRILSRAGGDLSSAPNERKGLTSTVTGEIGEAGGLAFDPNASAGERVVGGVGATAGAVALLLSGGVPAGVNPGKAVSGYVDSLNVERLLAGRRPIPNPVLGDLVGKIPVPAGAGNRIGFNRRGGIFIKNPSLDIETSEQYIAKASSAIEKRFVKLIETGKLEKYDPDTAATIQEATRQDIVDTLRSKANNPDLHRAISEVYGVTPKAIRADIKAAGQEAQTGAGVPTDITERPQVPESAYGDMPLTEKDKFDLAVMSGKRKLPSVGDADIKATNAAEREARIQALSKQMEGVTDKVDDAEFEAAARELGVDPVELRAYDSNIAKEMAAKRPTTGVAQPEAAPVEQPIPAPMEAVNAQADRGQAQAAAPAPGAAPQAANQAQGQVQGPLGTFSGSTPTPGGGSTTGFVGPSRYFGNKPGIANQSPLPQQLPPRPPQGPGPWGPPQGPPAPPPLQGPGPWGPSQGPPNLPIQGAPRRPHDLPTPWTPNPYFANKFGSIARSTPLNSDNQLERLERIGAEAARDMAKYPGKYSPEQAAGIEAIHETVERTKAANNKADAWYKEIGPIIDEAQSNLVGMRVKRSPEILDLKSYLNSPSDPRVRYSKMTAMVDDNVAQQFPNLQPLNPKQGNAIEAYKTGLGYASMKAKEVGVVTKGPMGEQYWDAPDGISRMFRGMPSETLRLMENDANFRDEALKIILAQPGNENVKLADAAAEFAHAYSTPEKSSALEHLRVIKVMPDQVFINGQWHQFNDFVHQAIPTKGYYGSGMGGVIKGQLLRSAIVDEFGTRHVGPQFKDLLEGQNGLLAKIKYVSPEATDEVQSLMAAVSGKRADAGYLPEWKIPPAVKRNALVRAGTGLVKMFTDTVTGGVWLKDFMRPVYQAAMDVPGGPIKKLLEAGVVTADQARNIFGGAVTKTLGRRVGGFIAQPYQAKVAEQGMIAEDYVNGLHQLIPYIQGERNSLSKIENIAQATSDTNPFKIAGQFMNDLVFGASESTTINTAKRTAASYIKRAVAGANNEADFTKLANDGISGKSIEWLKSIKGKPGFRDIDAEEFTGELVSNTVSRFNKQIGSAVQNQKLMNTPFFTKNVPFLNYDYTMQRAGEDTLKTARSILSLTDISPAEKATLISKKIVNYGVKLGVLAGSGEAVRFAVNTILGRKETDWEKAPWTISRLVSDLFATRMLGVGAMVADAAMEKMGVPRPWSKVQGKEQHAHMPAEVAFGVKAAEAGLAVPAAILQKGLKSAGVPIKNEQSVGAALQKFAGGPLSKPILGAPEKKGGRSAADALKLFGPGGGNVAPKPIVPTKAGKGRSAAEALQLFK